MTSLLFVLIGAAAGQWRPQCLRQAERFSPRALDALLCCLLFFTSLTFGLDREISGSIGRLGLTSLVTAAFAVAASAGAGLVWSKIMSRRATDGTNTPPPGPSQPIQPASSSMSSWVAASVVAGWGLGFAGSGLHAAVAALALTLSSLSLCGLLLVIGYNLGKDRVWLQLKEYGIRSLTLPISVGIASLVGAAMASIVCGLPLNRGLAAGSGFGWYSMAGPLALRQGGTEIAAYVFLSNLLREVLTILTVPFLATRRAPATVAAAMGGATAMDSTLGVISQAFGVEGAMWGLVTGTALTLVSPFILSFFLGL